MDVSPHKAKCARRWVWLAATEQVPARARKRVQDALEEWGLPADLAYDIRLAVSELVTNAIMHGAPPIRAILRISEHQVSFDVKELGEQHEMAVPSLEWTQTGRADYGRGIAIVSGITDAIGVNYDKQGRKSVWFVKEVA